jgi:hypothetical protein
MHSWEVVCIGVDEESEYDDCRRIETLGYDLNNRVKEAAVDKACLMMDSELSGYHVTVDDRRYDLEPVVGDLKYVRSLEEDSPEDPLLSLPTLEEYRRTRRFDAV